jgi:cellulose synthase (UDP-forming)
MHGPQRLPGVSDLAPETNPGAAFRLYLLEQWRRRRGIRHTISVIFLCTSLIYLAWRLTVFNPEAPIFSVVFYLSEVIGFFLAASMIVVAWRYRFRAPVEATPGLAVDVFIPTYNEPVEMIRRTVLAAMRIRYPHETWLLDDGNRLEVRAIAEELGCHYIARPENTGAKPGNLNHAMKYGNGDFIAVFDADFVSQINFLDCVMGYFSDGQVAFVQCPQSYYNITAFQYRSENRDRYLWHDEGPFYDVLQPGRDYWNATSSCGTSVVYRRSALDSIGGFAPETVTEDMHTAVRLHKRGYNSVYYPKPLAYGVAPNDLAEYCKTRHRWGQGNIQGLRCEGVPFCRGLTLMQRICYLQLGTMYLEGWQRLICYLTPPFILMTGLYPIDATNLFFWFFIPYIVLDYLCFEETLRGYGRVYLNEQLCMSRFPVYILSTFAIFCDYARWRVSSKKIVGDLPVYLLSPQLAVLILNVAGLGFGVATIIQASEPVVPRWITAFVCMFAVIYSLLALLVIREAVKRAKYKRGDFRFDIPFPVHVRDRFGGFASGAVASISTAGMSVVLPAPVLAASVKGTVYLPNGPLDFVATPEAPEAFQRAQGRQLKTGEVALLFQWDRQADKDRLDLILHACGWHRRFVHPSGYMTTPLEWLQNKLSRHPRVVPREKWKFVLYCRHGDDPRPRMAALLVSPRELDGRMVAFEALPLGCHLTLLDAMPGGQAACEIIVTARGELPRPSEIEADGVAMVSCRFSRRVGSEPQSSHKTLEVAEFAQSA